MSGFEGFLSVAELRANPYRAIPERGDGRRLGGVYVARCDPTETPRFERSNRRDEWTLPVAALRARRIAPSPGAYIGKADATEAGNCLRKRVSRYLRASSSHPAGKRMWQLATWDELTIAWRVVGYPDNPRAEQVRLLDEHSARFGRHPFANG